MAAAKSTVRRASVATSLATADLAPGIVGLLQSVRLDRRERTVLALLVSGQTLKSIGQGFRITRQRVHQVAEIAVRKIGEQLQPGWTVLPGAIGRFQAMLREERAEVLRERGQRVSFGEMRLVAAAGE